MQVIIYEQPDGGIAVVYPTEEGLELGLDELIARTVPQGAKHEIVDHAVLPKTRENRDAWKMDRKAVVVDQVKAAALSAARAAQEAARK